MKIFLRIFLGILLIFWILLGVLFHVLFFYGLFCSPFEAEDKALTFFCLFLAVLWWGITAVLIKWKKEDKTEREQKRKAEEYKKKYISDVEIENPYFGNGVLVKDSGSDNICYTDIKSGFDRIFDSFGKKSDSGCDLYEFIVREDNIEYVLASLEEIYKRSGQIMEECYDKIYKEIIEFFEASHGGGECLKKEFNLDYLKENWYVIGLAIEDDGINFSIGIDAAENPEDNSYYEIIIDVDYNTQEAEVSFNVVW